MPAHAAVGITERYGLSLCLERPHGCSGERRCEAQESCRDGTLSQENGAGPAEGGHWGSGTGWGPVGLPASRSHCVPDQYSLRAHLQSEDEGPLLSHSWTGLAVSSRTFSLLVSWRAEQEKTPPQPAPAPREEPHSYQARPQQWVWKGLGLGACCGQLSDRQLLDTTGQEERTLQPGSPGQPPGPEDAGVGLARPTRPAVPSLPSVCRASRPALSTACCDPSFRAASLSDPHFLGTGSPPPSGFPAILELSRAPQAFTRCGTRRPGSHILSTPKPGPLGGGSWVGAVSNLSVYSPVLAPAGPTSTDGW